MNPRSGISVFLRQVDRPRRLARVLVCAATDAIVLGCLVWLVEVLAPDYLMPALVVAIAWVVTGAVVRYLRSRTSVAELDREFECEDALVTWTGQATAALQPEPSPMIGWLEADLSVRLAAIPAQARRAPVRERLRPLRYLVPILIALLILRWLQPTFLTPPLGGGGGGGGGGGASSGEGEGGTATASAGEGSSGMPESPSPETPSPETPKPETPSPEIPPPEQQEPDPTSLEAPQPPDPFPPESSDPDEVGATPPNADSPLLDLALRDDFVIPQFLGDGPSKRDTAHVAEVGQPVDGSPAQGRRQPTGVSSGGTDREQPEPPDDELASFEHAAERALRSRHIKDAERAVVRRYFELVLRRRDRR